MRGITTRVCAAVGAGVLAVSLAGCTGGDDDSGLPSAGSSATSTTASPTTTASATATSSATGTGVAAGAHFTITRGERPAGLTGQRRAAADAYFAYWGFLQDAFGTPSFDLTKAGQLMGAGALTGAKGYADSLRQRHRRVAGTSSIGISTVTVRGATATVCGPDRDQSFEVDRKGVPQESVLPEVVTFKATLRRDGPDWRVVTRVRAKSC